MCSRSAYGRTDFGEQAAVSLGYCRGGRKLLVFLIAQDDVPSLRRDKSLRAMIEEKVKERSQKMVTSDVSGAPSVASSDTALAPVMTAAVQQQGQKSCLYYTYAFSDVTLLNYLNPA